MDDFKSNSESIVQSQPPDADESSMMEYWSKKQPIVASDSVQKLSYTHVYNSV